MENNHATEPPNNVPTILTKTARICYWLLLADLLLSGFITPLSYVIPAFHALLMLRLGKVDHRFRTAGIIEIVAIAGANLIPTFSSEIVNAVRGLSISALSLLFIYFEFTAYSDVLKEAAPELSANWNSNRDIYLLLKGVMFVCICFSGISALGTFVYLFQDFMGILSLVSPFISIGICISYWKTAKLGKK